MGTGLFSGINKYLLLIFLFLGIFIAVQLFYTATKTGSTPPTAVLYPTLTPFPPPSAPPAANLEFYRTIRNGQQVTSGSVVTSEFKGKLTALTIGDTTIDFKIDNGQGFEHELSYSKNVPFDKTGLSISDIKVGDSVILTETNDVTKSYPTGIQKIKIVTYY